MDALWLECWMFEEQSRRCCLEAISLASHSFLVCFYEERFGLPLARSDSTTSLAQLPFCSTGSMPYVCVRCVTHVLVGAGRPLAMIG